MIGSILKSHVYWLIIIQYNSSDSICTEGILFALRCAQCIQKSVTQILTYSSLSVELCDVVFSCFGEGSCSISCYELHSILVYDVCFKGLLASWTAFYTIVSYKHYLYIFLLLISSKLIWIILLKSVLTWSIYNSVILYLLNGWMSGNFWRFLVVKACIAHWISNSGIASNYFRIQKLIWVLIRVPQFLIYITMTSCSLRLLSIRYIGNNTTYISIWLRHRRNSRRTTKIYHLIW